MAFGVYGIFFPGKWVYVGSTIASFDTRHRVHLKALKDNRHDNLKMQELFNKFCTCEFRTLEESTDKSEVRELEQFYMEEMQRQGYNLCNETPALIEGNPLGDIVKQKISKGRRGGKKRIDAYKSEEVDADEIMMEDRSISDYHKRNMELRKEQGW